MHKVKFNIKSVLAYTLRKEHVLYEISDQSRNCNVLTTYIYHVSLSERNKAIYFMASTTLQCGHKAEYLPL